MKKYIILLILLVFPFINAKCISNGSLNGVNYYEFKPSNATSSTKVIFAFHGIGASTSDMNTFGAYKQINSINPNAVVVFPTKGSGGWNTSTYSNFVKSYLSTNGYTGSVGYYGFSYGALDGPPIIAAAGVFDSAVLVDEDFVATYKLGVDGVYNQLSTINSLKVFCGQHCDSDSTLNTLQSKFSAAGKTMEIDSNANRDHATMNSYAASPGINFLTGTRSNPSPNPQVTTTTTTTTKVVNTSVTPQPSSSVTTTNGGGENNTNSEYKYCPLGDDVTKDLVGVLRLMKILAPLLVIIYTTYEAVLAITKGQIEEESRKLFNKFARRAGAALLLFAIPVIVDAMMQLMNIWDDKGHCVLEPVQTTSVDVKTPEQQCLSNCDKILDAEGQRVCKSKCTTTTTETCEQRCGHIGDETGRQACLNNCKTTKPVATIEQPRNIS